MYNPENKTGFLPQEALSKKLAGLGITNVDKLQSGSKVIFDTIGPVFGVQNEMIFFSQNRQLPQTNFPNRFGLGEAMILQNMVVVLPVVSNGAFATPWGTLAQNGYFSIKIGNTVVIDSFPFAGNDVAFLQNYAAGRDSSVSYNFQFNSLLLLPPDVDFQVTFYQFNAAGTELAPVNVLVMLEGVSVELNSKF